MDKENKDLIINGGTIYTMGSSVGGDAGIDTDGSFEINYEIYNKNTEK